MDDVRSLKRELIKYKIFEDMLQILGKASDISLSTRIVESCKVISLLNSQPVSIPHRVLILYYPQMRLLEFYSTSFISSEKEIPDRLFVDGWFEKNVLSSGDYSIKVSDIDAYGCIQINERSLWDEKKIHILLPMKMENRLLGFVGVGKDEMDLSPEDIDFLRAYIAPINLFLSSAISHESMIVEPITQLPEETYFMKQKQLLFEQKENEIKYKSISFILCGIKDFDEIIDKNGLEIKLNILKELAQIIILFTDDPLSATLFNQNKFLITLTDVSFRETLSLCDRLMRFIDSYPFTGKVALLKLNSLFTFYRHTGKRISFSEVLNLLQRDFDRNIVAGKIAISNVNKDV